MKYRYALLQILVLVIALTVGATLPLGAQSASGPTIVLVDGDRATLETAVGQQVRDRVNAAAEQWQSRITGLQTELNSLGQQRQTQQLTLSQQALTSLNTQIEEKQVELQRVQDDARRAIERLQIESVEAVNGILIPVLEAMAAERGYQIVLDTRMTQTGGLLYFSNVLDVTDEFIARVNASQPAVQ
jgi:Skp family chaperone for outer membrane proteins